MKTPGGAGVGLAREDRWAEGRESLSAPAWLQSVIARAFYGFVPRGRLVARGVRRGLSIPGVGNTRTKAKCEGRRGEKGREGWGRAREQRAELGRRQSVLYGHAYCLASLVRV